MIALDEKEKKINQAYYAIGTEKLLIEEGLVVKEGAVLGLGKTTAIEKDVLQEKFQQIHIRQTQNLLIDFKKVNLLTEHPSDSYEIIKEGETTKFIDSNELWRISKYLVVAVKS